MSDRGYFKAWLEKLVGNYRLFNHIYNDQQLNQTIFFQKSSTINDNGVHISKVAHPTIQTGYNIKDNTSNIIIFFFMKAIP